MRLTLPITALLAATSSFARSTPAQHPHPHPVVVYLHPAPQPIGSGAGDHLRAPLLSSEQAQAVLSHHLEGGVGNAEEEEYEKLAGGDAEWAHAAVMKGKGGRTQGDKAKVVIIQADVRHSDILPPVLLHENPSFYLSWNHESHDLLRPYMNRARHVVDHIVDALPASIPKLVGDIWDLSTSKTASLLNKQLQALSAIAERLPWLDRSHPVSEAWESIMITALGSKSVNVKHEDAIEEEVRREGCLGVKAALEAMTSGPDQPPLVIIFLPSDLPQFHFKVPTGKRSWIPDFPVANAQALGSVRRSSAENDNKTVEAAGTCYPSNRTCALGTSTCSGHGSCVWSGNSTDSLTGECWSCKCSSGYLGVQCQKGDYVFQTILLIFTPLLILVVILMSVGLLSSVGGEKLPSTLNVSVGVPSKRD